MKKPIIVIALIILIAAGSVGTLYATGNLNKIIDKIFNRSEVLDMSDEKNFDEILKRVKENLDEVKSVRAEVKGSSWRKSDDYAPETYSGKSEINFVFPDKKSILPIGSSGGSMNLEFGVRGTMYETIILGEKIYKKFPYAGWIYGMNGKTVPLGDGGRYYLPLNLNEYPKGWDLTKNIREIEKEIGEEEISGIKCRHYKVKINKISCTQKNLEAEKYFFDNIIGLMEGRKCLPLKEGDILEQDGDNVRYITNGKEILIPIVKPLTMPIMYSSIEWDEYLQAYYLKTWAIEGEIWVGEDNFLVYKESYKTEHYSSYYYPEKSAKSSGSIWKNNIEITYSDFNGDIKIEAPVETSYENVMTVEEYLNPTEKQISVIQMKKRDQERKGILQQNSGLLKQYYDDYGQYPIANELEKISDENSNYYKILAVPERLPSTLIEEYLFDPLDPEFYYTYKSDGRSYELTARLENLEDEDCVMENGICLYKCKDGVCGK